jgi:hypothetical protein
MGVDSLVGIRTDAAIRLSQDEGIASGYGDQRRADGNFNRDIPPPVRLKIRCANDSLAALTALSGRMHDSAKVSQNASAGQNGTRLCRRLRSHL